ncbi:hypothetical protein BST27_09970 [Mycobacterium intermedium]|uniref:Uncharacterized protein n=1 Tax=Mycobacterium intermedium TaxID=28445 RepID=A0A1E3SC75_MYCIE|nr:hypothetical protein [Mycobacterium intermedium]MCV6966828.1 hypothetical protein [Mycobacterium intermedium]ODQ99719.1 hypothetical protein BHQ20_16395 [Mycobacterium intermedium]ORB07227.1 hypothetical protein BST27_09970 [Mycobacterium intermedium]
MRTGAKALLGAAVIAVGFAAVAPAAAHADGCVQVGGWGGQCDFNYAPDGSHEHCDNGWAPFVGRIQNCFWVSARPVP